MDISYILKGILLGFSIAAPVGPIGILCIRRTLQFGRFSGLFSGLGAAVADTLYGVVAALGMAFVTDFLLAHKSWFQLVGGLFLIYLGIKTFFNRPREHSVSATHTSLLGDFFSTFFLTLTNPMTILSYVAIFASFGLSKKPDDTYSNTIGLVAGVFIGSALWWLILSEGVTLFRKKVSLKVMLWINRIAGILIILFGVIALISSILSFTIHS